MVQVCPCRPAAFENKMRWKWPAKSNVTRPNNPSSSPLLHLHEKIDRLQSLGRIQVEMDARSGHIDEARDLKLHIVPDVEAHRHI